MAKPQSKKTKYSKEVEEIRRMRDLSRILKAGDVENALLSNSAKDSETMNDNVLDSLLNNANSIEQRGDDRGLEVIQKLTTASGTKQKKVSVQRSGSKIKVKRSFHMTKTPSGKKKGSMKKGKKR